MMWGIVGIIPDWNEYQTSGIQNVPNLDAYQE
jgi:hypothetical protein